MSSNKLEEGGRLKNGCIRKEENKATDSEWVRCVRMLREMFSTAGDTFLNSTISTDVRN